MSTSRHKKKSKTDIWMPLHIGDYLGDTMHLTTEQHGAYLLLLMHYWRTGPLRTDDTALACTARVSIVDWVARFKDTILAFFSVGEEDGLLHQGRMDFERAKARHKSEERRAAANKKWEKRRGEGAGDSTRRDPPPGAEAHFEEPPPDYEDDPFGDGLFGAEAEGMQMHTQSQPQPQVQEPVQQEPIGSRSEDDAIPKKDRARRFSLREVSGRRQDAILGGYAGVRRESDSSDVNRPFKYAAGDARKATGQYLEHALRVVIEAGRPIGLNEDWKGDWQILINWLNAGINIASITEAIGQVARNRIKTGKQTEEVGSLWYFNRAVQRVHTAKTGEVLAA